MNFTQSIAAGFRNYSSIEGRASRSEFWNWMLFCYLGGPAAAILDMIFFRGFYDPFSPHPFNALFALAVLVPTVAVGVRRLHDLGRTGWWLLLWPTIIGIIPLLIWFCMKGTAGDNRFGAEPLEGVAAVSKS